MTDYVVVFYLGTEFLFKRENIPVPRVGDIVKNVAPDDTDEYLVKEVCFKFYKRNENLLSVIVQLEWR